jgi:PAS domain S-box-containing protein
MPHTISGTDSLETQVPSGRRSEALTPAIPASQAEQGLLDARRRVESVLAAVEVGTWIYDIPADEVWADENLRGMFGVSAAEAAGGKIAAYLAGVHPEDRPGLEAAIAVVIKGGTKFVEEYRIRRADGSYRTVIARGTVERGAGGEALRLPGVILDISDRVRAETERLALSVELDRTHRMAETMLSSIADFAYIFDLQGRFVFANKPLLDLWGLELKEAVGKDFYDLKYEPVLAATLQRQIQQVIETGKPLSDRTPYTSSAGVSGYYEYIFTPVFAADGAVEFVAGSTRDITESQHVFEALQRSEKNFRTLAETLPQIVWAAQADGSLDYYNGRWFEYIGLSPEAVAEARWDLYIHPEDLPGAYAGWSAALSAGTAYCMEFRVRRADGMYRWFLVRALPVLDAQGTEIVRWFGTCTDIHDQRELQARLEQSEAHFRQMANSIPQLAWMAHPNGDIFWYNNRWHEYTGTTPEEMQRLGWEPLHDAEHLPAVKAAWEAALASGMSFDMTFPLKGADGVFHPFLTRCLPIRDEAGEIVLWFGTNTDVSEQRRIIQEREELLESERAARSAAEQASRMKDEFLATLSHELRSPLSAISGWSQILRESTDDPAEILEGLDVVDRNVRVLTQLIEDLLDMSRIISGKLRMNVQQINPCECITAAIETVKLSAEAKGIRIESILDPGTGVVSGDPVRLQQVIWNLLSNSIKFTPRGGRVQVLLQRVNSHIEICVADNGLGITAEFLPEIFGRFRQADGATTRKHGGLGLGLAIVKQLVELHGGTIHARSDGLDKGATFVVKLPLKIVHAAMHEDEWQHPGSMGTLPAFRRNVELKGLRILIVDDEDDAREMLRRLLEGCGAELFTARSAVEGLAQVEARLPDVLISDIGMPEVDGYEFLRRVRALPAAAGGRVPAVALTAFARSEDRTRALRSGFHSHVSKPVEPMELIATIAALVDRGGE